MHPTRRLHPEDIATVDRIPCTSLGRTLVDEAETESERGLERMIDRAEELGIYDLDDIQRALKRASGKSGARKLQRITGVAADPALTRNDLEERFYAICAQAGLPRPHVNLPITLEDGGPHVVADFAWPELRLIVETDGWATHGTRRAFVYDRHRDRRWRSPAGSCCASPGPRSRTSRPPSRLNSARTSRSRASLHVRCGGGCCSY